MYLTNYKNKEGVVIFTALSDEVFASLTVKGDTQRMEFPKNKWKEVTLANEVEIISYADSEGNVWDLSYNSAFPYSYDTLSNELLKCLMNMFEVQADDYDKLKEDMKPLLETLNHKSNGESVLTFIKTQTMELRKLVSECENGLNPKTYDNGCEDVCEAPAPSIMEGQIGNSGRSLAGFRG